MRHLLRWACPLVLAGCSLLSPRLADPPEEIVAGFEATFPTLRELQVAVYMQDEECEYFVYSRGYFTSQAADEWCRVFADARDFMDPPPPVPFDDQAWADLATVKSAFVSAGVPLDYLNLGFTIDIDGGTNAFGYNGCYSFFYRSPASEEDPEAFDTVINDDWVVTDFCP